MQRERGRRQQHGGGDIIGVIQLAGVAMVEVFVELSPMLMLMLVLGGPPFLVLLMIRAVWDAMVDNSLGELAIETGVGCCLSTCTILSVATGLSLAWVTHRAWVWATGE